MNIWSLKSWNRFIRQSWRSILSLSCKKTNTNKDFCYESSLFKMYTSPSLLCHSNFDKLAPPRYSTDLERRIVKELREWKICLFSIDRAQSLKAPWKSIEHISCSRFYFLLSRVVLFLLLLLLLSSSSK